MKNYKQPLIDVLLFDEEEVLTASGYTAANAVTKMMGDDAGYSTKSSTNINISTVKVSGLELD